MYHKQYGTICYSSSHTRQVPYAKRKNLFCDAYENITNNTKLRFYARNMRNFEQEHKTNKIPSEILNMTTF